ncbi:MAG: hypothetical protein INR71_06965, partial [Terriglobus roseus]|nr:hypothetical protein [Terriglobus roseus]
MEVLTEYGQLNKIGEPISLDQAKMDDATAPAQPGAITGGGSYGNKPAPQAAPQNRSLPSRPNNTQHANLYPIEALSPYAHRWTIKARCTNKSDIKTWHKASGEGKLFSVNLLDESGEIRATGFNAECDSLYDFFQEGSIYYISSPCRVQLAKKQFTQLNNDYELTFESGTVVEKAEDQDSSVPQVRYNFTAIGSLQGIEKDSTIDCIGILKEIGEVSQITSKTTSKPYDKRELQLVDDTMHSVRLTIWGNTATTFEAPLESVVAFKGVKVSDFGGRSLSLLSSGSMNVDPDIDEAHKLKGWFDALGGADTFTAQAQGAMAGGRKDEYKTASQVLEESLGMSEQPDYFTIKATIVYIRQETVAYPACQSANCNKKLTMEEWRCENCERTWPKPLWRYIMTANVEDHTGQLWLNIFDDVGKAIMGMPADDVMDMKENDEQAAAKAFDDANCKTFVFR